MLKPNALCSLEELKTFIGMDLTDTSKDSTLEVYINGASKQIENLIGRFILAKDYAEKYKGTNSNELVLKHYPINSIVSIKFICDGEEYETLDTTDYDIEEDEGILYRDLGWQLEGYSTYMSRKINYPRRYIKVEYNGGFEDVPADLKLICMRGISDNYAMDNSQGGILKSYSISDVRMDYKDEIKFSKDDMETILSYKAVKF